MSTLFATAPFPYPGFQWAGKAQFMAQGIELFKEDVRSLNTAPVAFIEAPHPTQLIIPVQIISVGKAGTVAYSAAPGAVLQWTTGDAVTTLLNTAWDGTVASIAYASYQAAPDGDNLLSRLGVGLEITASADVTSGDAPLTVMFFYLLASLAGLL